MKDLKDYVRTIPDFPKKGIQFRDVTTILQDEEGLQLAINSMQEKLKDIEFDVIVAPEARGFIFGVPISYNMKKPFVPVRKKGKLPFKTMEQSYDLEYGTETLEIHIDAITKGMRVVIVDDLIATGGSVEAIIKLIESLGGVVAFICCLIELPSLKGRERLKNYDVSTIMSFEGE